MQPLFDGMNTSISNLISEHLVGKLGANRRTIQLSMFCDIPDLRRHSYDYVSYVQME